MDADSGQGGTDIRTSGQADMPTWVSWFTDGGRPVVAVLVMVMCAPGEHHLATMAGWENWLAWGMPGCLVIYTGIAAVVATKRSKGAPGKNTAVVGAILSLLLAMSAQPISHLFVTGIWHGDPWPLVVVVSCIPPMVLGHLLHLAAGGPVREQRRTTADNGGQSGDLAEGRRTAADDSERTRADADSGGQADTTVWRILPDSGQGYVHPERLQDADSGHGRTERPDALSVSGVPEADSGQDTRPSGTRVSAAPDYASAPVRVRPIASGHLSAFITGYLADAPDAADADIRSAARSAFPDTKPDTIRKAVNRVRDAQRAAA